MTKPKHGGTRTGAGRPPGAQNRRTVASNEAAATLPHCTDPRAFLEAVMGNAGIDTRLRIEAAKCLMPFIHSRAELGKKDQAQTAAKKAGFGRFSASKPPLRVVGP